MVLPQSQEIYNNYITNIIITIIVTIGGSDRPNCSIDVLKRVHSHLQFYSASQSGPFDGVQCLSDQRTLQHSHLRRNCCHRMATILCITLVLCIYGACSLDVSEDHVLWAIVLCTRTGLKSESGLTKYQGLSMQLLSEGGD